jgi:hypothetical protein
MSFGYKILHFDFVISIKVHKHLVTIQFVFMTTVYYMVRSRKEFCSMFEY